MDLTPIGTSFGLISALATIVGLASRALAANAVRRRRVGFEDWKAEISTHDGKIWMRAYLEELEVRSGSISKSAGV